MSHGAYHVGDSDGEGTELYVGYANASGALSGMLMLLGQALGATVFTSDDSSKCGASVHHPDIGDLGGICDLTILNECGSGSDVDTIDMLSSLSSLLDEEGNGESSITPGCFDQNPAVHHRNTAQEKEESNSSDQGRSNELPKSKVNLRLEPVMEELVVQGFRGICGFSVVLGIYGSQGYQEHWLKPPGQLASLHFCEGCDGCDSRGEILNGSPANCARVSAAFFHVDSVALLSCLSRAGASVA